ncbi:MAG: ribosomal L7Ae/L30e/S12e/Gadd45 family protein [Oscillospiraceae bacterium]|nr:ribosomal L7Ae/L30e/S12e/Gadd45 family protein [Oscillospiraceae bacterium]
MLDSLKSTPRVVGVKQTRKVVLAGEAQTVFVARDAEARVVQPVLAACEQAGVPVTWAETMAELGAACGIEVGAAVAAIQLTSDNG